ncbi:MAG: tetratricopeptide repeat protein [Fulvivirga sp.]|uniref:type IX secretion system periplasmic lipoprotein PorW/SprE n=1 Tax=Fulvivirga sp. TaxID=1931237 RepID=UPI0032EB93CC
MALLLDGCSAERKNILSKTYHNTTARYNAYFYAKKRIKEIEAILKENIDNDYNNILRIYPEIDSTLATTYQDKIDDCIKKASIAIQRHKNSKWVDDSYIFIGRARLYSLDYVNAIETFKFVNTESEDDNARHEALIRLLRTFVDYQEFENAVAVEDYIKKEKLNKQNQKLLYLNQAHHYQVKEDFDKMVANLVLAAPLLKRKDGKGRIYFIIGQIYQELGFDAEAFNYYRKCLASNPEYELDFYTRLNMAQVTELGKSSDVRAARKVLNSLLKDSKNKEFKDKIYFEMAEFELKQGNRNKAIDNFESSIASSVGNQRQKGQSYLRLGEVYYDTLKRYELAQAYYDSAIQALPQDFENINAIKARQQVLGEFVKNLKTIEVQDSILRLSTLDSASITAKLNNYLDEQAEKRKALQKKEERKARRTQASAFNSNSGISSTGWYFGNPSAVALGQSEFKRIWGERPLEDNWRRSIKESVQSLNVNNTSAEVEENTDVANSQTSENIDAGANLNALYREIPFSEEAKQESLNKIEAAYYALGNIYKYDLDEDANAADAFKTLITRFPETENKPEALYQLYLIYKELSNEEYNIYKDALLNDFPNTVYAKLIANPNYTEESTATNEKLKKIYEKAYGYFSQENYDTTLYILNDALSNYEETVFTSRLKLLKILVTGKTEDINLYQYQLSEFIKNNPDSEVAPYAEELLAASRSFLERKRKRLGTEYVKYLEQSHYLVYIYELESGLTDAVSQSIDNYNAKHAGLNLKTSNLILNDDLAMILISDFENKIDAFEYYSDFVKSDPIDEAKRNSKFYKFVITKDNFNIFYQSKDLEAYLKFFEKNYINGIN